MADEVARLLANSQRTTEAAARVTVERTDAWTAVVATTTRGVGGERAISGASCESVARAVALIIALAVDPEISEARQDPAPAAAREPAATIRRRPKAVSAHAAATSPPDRSSSCLGFRARAALLAGSSAVAAPAAGAALAASGFCGPLGVQLEARYWFPRDVADDDSAATASLSAQSGSAGLCVAAGELLTVCSGYELTRLSGTGVAGVSAPRDGIAWSSAVFVSGGAAMAVVGPLSIALLVRGGVALQRPRFVIEGLGPLHRVPRIQADAGLGAQLDF